MPVLKNKVKQAVGISSKAFVAVSCCLFNYFFALSLLFLFPAIELITNLFTLLNVSCLTAMLWIEELLKYEWWLSQELWVSEESWVLRETSSQTYIQEKSLPLLCFKSSFWIGTVCNLSSTFSRHKGFHKAPMTPISLSLHKMKYFSIRK